MNGTNLFKIALRALANNKLRAFLTMLGIIIGVASVITMLAIGQGSKRSIQQQISEMGSNMIMIHPGADRRGGVRQDPSAMQTLKLTDYEALRDETNFLSAISPNVSSSGQLIAGNNNYPSSVSGVGLEYLEIRQLSVETGDMFTEADIQSSAKVCVIGKTIVDNLFPDGGDPIGKIIRFNKIPFRVVGVLKAKGYNSMGQDQDNIVLAPYTTVMKRLLAVTYLQGVFASALTEDMTEYATDEITEILRRNHKLKASDEDDFTIRTQQELSTMLNSTTDLMTTLLACIAGISLVVGGIGIMNIMYVSVTERTREIGLRMSVGARGVDILSQFLIEAILISITGGLIGVVIGCGASWIVKSVAHWPIFIQPWSVFLSFAVCTVTGVFFGWYPAKKAADLDPIEAIRYEQKTIFVFMKQTLTSARRPLEALIHVIGWGIMFGFPFFFVERENGNINWMAYVRHSAVPLSFMIVFYVNYFLLVPRYLFQSQNKRYITYNILLLCAIGLMLHLWRSLTFDPSFVPKHRSGVPPGWLFFVRDMLSLVFTIGLSAAIRMSARWTQAEAARKEAERSRSEAELKNLRNQLNPHFLLNTLNNIYALIAFDTDKAQQAVQELSKLLRYVLYDNQQTYVPLGKETDFIRNYIELMRIRLSANVQMTTQIDIQPDSQTLIAPLIFISLIENAFKHGISPTERSFIHIHLAENDTEVICEISNSNHPKNITDKSGSGIGLEQVSRRLEILYPGQYTWQKGISEDGKEYKSRLSIRVRDRY